MSRSGFTASDKLMYNIDPSNTLHCEPKHVRLSINHEMPTIVAL